MTSASWAADWGRDRPGFGPRTDGGRSRDHQGPHAERRHRHHTAGRRGHASRPDGPREAFGFHMSHGGPGSGFFGRGFGPDFRDIPFPFGPKWGPHGRRRRGPRAGRGDVRAGILALLAEEPRNGYQIIQELQQRSGGVWRVSPGSVYPALSQLEDEGLIVADQQQGKRVFTLTEAGRSYVQEHEDEISAPWNAFTRTENEDSHGLYAAIGPAMMAVAQVAQAGTPAQVAEATRLIEETRRALYRILAEGGDPDEDEDAASSEPSDDE